MPVRAAAAVQARSRSFDEHSEVELTDSNRRTIEIDLLFIADGRIIIGEAKTNDRLEKTERKEIRRIQSMREIAQRITADHIIFASSVEFRDATKKLINDELANSEIRWEFLEHLAPASLAPIDATTLNQ